MPDLGLDKVGDEQLLNLLQEAVAELLSRDPIMCRVAQDGVLSLQAKRESFMTLVKAEIVNAQASYIEALRQYTRGEIQKEIASGEINIPGMVGSAKEAKIIAECTAKEIQAIKDDMKRAPEKSSFSVVYNGNDQSLKVSYHSAGQNWDAKRQLSLGPALRENVRKAVLGAFGIPEN